jgi:hypothetical protein
MLSLFIADSIAKPLIGGLMAGRNVQPTKNALQ